MKTRTTQELVDLVKDLPNKDKYIYFIGTLINKNAFNKSVYLSSENLRRTFGNDYPIIKQFLLDNNLITVSKYYGDKFFSYSYKLTFSNKNIIDYELVDIQLINKINRFIEANYAALPSFLKKMGNNLDKLMISSELKNKLLEDGIEINDEILLTKQENFSNLIKRNKNGRVFNTITSMKRIYRELLHVNGEQLVEIDGKNAQLICLQRMVPSDISFSGDVTSGVFYEKLATYLNEDITNDGDRKDFKQKFMNSFLTNPAKACVKNSKFGLAMKALYPKTYDFIINFDLNESKAGLFQQKEAEFFIDIISQNLIDSDIFCISIHDAILIKASDLDKVIFIFNELSNKHFSYEIPTSFKHYIKSPTPCTPPISKIQVKGIYIEVDNIEVDIVVDSVLSGISSQGGVQSKNLIKSEETRNKFNLVINRYVDEGKELPSIRKLAIECGINPKRIQKYLKEMKSEMNIITNKLIEKHNYYEEL